jgi:hypothetical protein
MTISAGISFIIMGMDWSFTRRIQMRKGYLMRLVIMSSVILGAAVGMLNATPPAGRNWVLQWSDEFEGSFSTSLWHYWNNNGARNDVTLSGEKCITVANGNAVITVVKSGTVTYGAGLETNARYGAGYYEARISIGTGWNTFWVQAISGCTISEGTEMDIVENCRGSGHPWHADNYGASYSAPCYGYTTHDLGAPNVTDYHVYGLKWDDSTGATYYYDGVADWNLRTTKSASYTGPVRLTSEQAIVWSVMKIDYVRYYKDMGPTAVNEAPLPRSRSLSYGERVIKSVDGMVNLPPNVSGAYKHISAFDVRGRMLAELPVGLNGVARMSQTGNQMMLVKY